MRERQYDTRFILSRLLDACSDELEALVAEEVGEGPLIEKIRRRVDDIFGFKETPVLKVHLENFVRETLEEIVPAFSHRDIELVKRFEESPYQERRGEYPGWGEDRDLRQVPGAGG